MADSPKKIIGDYELLELMGTGAQGRVFKARCISSENPKVEKGGLVALKILNRASADPKEEVRFKRQADILEKLNDPGICKYIDYFVWAEGEFDETKCLVMEFLDGEALSDRLKKYRKGLPWEQVESIFTSCLEALIHACEQGVTHRDLKLSNIYLTHDGAAKVIDFGIARHEGGEETSTGGWKGSFDYMAPDFVKQEGFGGDEASDVYSLAVCFFQTLTGQLPFPALGESAHIGYLNRWNDDMPPSISFKNNKFRVLLHCKPLVRTGLSAERENRYQSFKEMLEDLKKVRYRVVRHRGKDDYELIDMLGRGGFGEVFEGRRVSDGRTVAIKHLFAGRQSSRFIKEAKVLQRYKHPDIVNYIDFIEVEGLGDDKEYFLIMEHLPGMPEADLRLRIKHSKTGLPVAEVVELFYHYLRALEYLHENPRPIIHRDIKPGNLYAPAGHPEKGKIFDLGVARDVSGTLTTGMIPGTLDYMAPEFALPGSDRGTPQSDLYALGVAFFEALTGRKPFPKLPRGDQEAFVQFVARAQKPLKVDYDEPAFKAWPELQKIAGKALASDPGKRYAAASAMLKDLENLMQQGLDAEYDEDDAPTRATEVNPELLERIKRSAAAHVQRPDEEPESSDEPQFQPPSELETFVDPPDIDEEPEPAPRKQERPVAREEPAQPATPKEKKTLGHLAMRFGVGAIVVSLAGYGAYSVLRGIPAGVARSDSSNFVEENSAPVANEQYVQQLQEALTKAQEWEGKDLMHSPFWKEQVTTLQGSAGQLPGAFEKEFQAAVKKSDLNSAIQLAKAWDVLEGREEFIQQTTDEYVRQREEIATGVDRLRFYRLLTDMNNELPDTIRIPAEVAAAEKVSKSYRDALSKTWKGVDVEDADKELAKVRSMLVRNAKEYIDLLRSTSVGRYEALENGDGPAQDLKSMGVKAPTLVGLVGEGYEVAVAAVEQAKATKEGKAGYAALVARIDETLPSSVSGDSELVKAEQAAGMLREFLSTDWQGIEQRERKADANRFRDGLVTALSGYIQSLETTATEKLQKLEDADASWAALQAIGEKAPVAVGLVKNPYNKSVRTVAALRLEKENKATFAQALKKVSDTSPAMIETPADVANAEAAAQSYQAFSEKNWAGIDPSEVLRSGNLIRDNLAQTGSAYVEELRQNAFTKLKNLEDASSEWEQLTALGTNAPALVSLISSAYAAAVSDVGKAQGLKESVAMFVMAKNQVAGAIPEKVEDDDSLLAAEKAMQAYTAFTDQTFEGISIEERDNAVREMRTQLAQLATGYIATLKKGALDRFSALEDADDLVARLKDFDDKAPSLLRLVTRDYEQAVRVVTLAQDNKENLAAYTVGLNGVRENLPEQIASLSDLRMAEKAAESFSAFETKAWEGIEQSEQVAQKSLLRDSLMTRAGAYVESLQQAALSKLTDMEDAESEIQQLESIGKEAPYVSEIVAEKYSSAVRSVELAVRKNKGMSEFTVALEAVYKLLAGEIKSTEQLASKEQAHRMHADMSAKTWEAVAPEEREAAFSSMDEALTRGITAYIDRLKAAAMDRFMVMDDADEELQQLRAIKKTAPNLVGRIGDRYQNVLTEVQAASDRKDQQVAFQKALDDYDAKVPLSLASLQNAEEAEAALALFREIKAADWPGVLEKDVNQRLSQRRGKLLDLVSGRVASLRNEATAKFQNLEDADDDVAFLKGIGEKAPTLVGLLEREYTDAVRDVVQAQNAKVELAEFRALSTRLEGSIPEDWSVAESLAQAEQAALEFISLAGREWKLVPAREKAETLLRIRGALQEQAKAHVAQLTVEATTRFQNLEDGDPQWEALRVMGEQTPTLVSMAGDAYRNAVQNVGAARDAKVGISEFRDALANLQRTMPASISSPDELAKAETAAVSYAAIAQREWTAISASERREKLEGFRSGLEEGIEAYVERLKAEALERYAAMEDGSTAKESLEDLAKTSPQLVALIGEAYPAAVAEVSRAASAREGLITYRAELAKVRDLLPNQVGGAKELAAAERAVKAYQQVAATDWPAVSSREKNDSLSEIRARIVAMIAGYMGSLEKKAVENYANMTNADPVLEELKAISTKAPNLVGMVFNSYEKSVKAATSARSEMVKKVKIVSERKAYDQVQAAWDAIQADWNAGGLGGKGEDIDAVLNAAFEIDEFAEAYKEIRSKLLEGMKSRVTDSIAAAQVAVNEYLAQGFQVDDPSFSGSYRALSDDVAPLRIDMPAVKELENLDTGVPYLELVRLEAWRLASSKLGDKGTRRKLAGSLGQLAADARQRGLTELAQQAVLEQALLGAEPAVFPGEHENTTSPAGFLRWRAHANYQPEVSSLDVLEDLGRFASQNGALNQFDLRLVMFAAYYSWRNAIDGETDYARKVETSLAQVLSKASEKDAQQAIQFLIGYIEEGGDDDEEYPGLYMMRAVSSMTMDSPAVQAAKAWMVQNAGAPPYSNRMVSIKPQTDLLQRLLK